MLGKHHFLTLSLVVAITFLSIGCAPRVMVRKNPSDCDSGIRYYRPKPYLFISPLAQSSQTGSGSSTRTVMTPSDQFVNIQLQHLPDFSEEYSIDVNPRFGRSNVMVTLEDGWNLTAINQDLDSNFDENIGAVASLIDAVAPGVASTLGGTSSEGVAQPVQAETSFQTAARNIPLGYYESVIVPNVNGGGKRLCGWRYIGFTPFSSCSDVVGCNQQPLGGTEELFGLTFRNGVMVFEKLGTMSLRSPEQSSERSASNMPATVMPVTNTPGPLPATTRSMIIGKISGDLRNAGIPPIPGLQISEQSTQNAVLIQTTEQTSDRAMQVIESAVKSELPNANVTFAFSRDDSSSRRGSGTRIDELPPN